MKFPALCLLAALASFAAADESVQQTCRVSLTSNPSGATVVIDGQDRGVTPIILYDLSPGRHHVKFRRAGYDDADRIVDTRKTPFLERNTVMEETKGLLLIKSDPAGADIQVDGASIGQTPRLVTSLPARGTYSVRLRKAGYQDQTISVRFDGRKPLVRDEKLVLASGVLDIMSEPAGATVTVNGVERGVTPLKVTGVPKGRAIVKFSLDGYEEAVRDLAVSAGDVQTLPVVLKGLPGTMRVTSIPDGARVYVDDRYEGKAPLSLPGLKPGDYLVRVEMDGHGTLARTVSLANGESASEEFRLSSIMGPIEVVTSPAGATVTLDGRVVGVTKATPDAASDVSEPLVITNVQAGEHRLVVSRKGYAESRRLPVVENQKTTTQRIRLRRVFTPDVEIVTAHGTYRGILVANTPDAITLEVSLGITQAFPRKDVRKLTFLAAGESAAEKK